MARRINLIKCLVVLTLLYSLTLTFLLFLYGPGPGPPPCPLTQRTDDSPLPKEDRDQTGQTSGNKPNRGLGELDNRTLLDETDWGPHKMAVIVPFRDRLEELLEFAPYLHNYLTKKKVRHKIFIINQVDNLR